MSGRYVSLVLESDLAPDLKFTAAVLASFAKDGGTHIYPGIGYVAYLRGIEVRRVQVHMKELRDMEILEIVRAATQWLPTHYRMVIEKLPARPPFKPPDRQQSFLGGESPGDEHSGVHSTAPLSGVHSRVPGVQPTTPDPSLDPSVHTRTTRAREAGANSGVQPTAPLGGESALPLIVPPRRDPDHEAHAWCGRMCVPKFLHKQFKHALGGPVAKRAARMRTFYAETIAAMPVAQPIGEEPVRFWRRAFAVRFGGVAPSRETRRSASGYPSDGRGNCPHEPMCARARECTARTIAEARAERQAQSG